MLERLRKRVTGLILTATTVAIIPPIIFGTARSIDGQSAGDPWRDFIFDFQTLIGSLFAVGAAYATVRQMRDTDQKSEARHRELVELTIRGDRLTVERMLIPQFFELRELYKELRDAETISLLEDDLDNLDSAVKNYRACINKIKQLVVRQPWEDARPLFGGLLTHHLAELNISLSLSAAHLIPVEIACRELKQKLEEIQPGARTLKQKRESVEVYRERLQLAIANIPSDTPSVRVLVQLDKVFKELFSLADRYRIKI